MVQHPIGDWRKRPERRHGPGQAGSCAGLRSYHFRSFVDRRQDADREAGMESARYGWPAIAVICEPPSALTHTRLLLPGTAEPGE